MNDRPLKIGTGALAGAAAGALVGLADGIRAALLVGTGVRVAVTTALLAAGIDALLGLGAGAAIEVGARAAAWGRSARAPWWARVVAWAVFGLAAAAAAAAVVVATAGRHNRFLAAGLVTLAAAGTAVAGVVFAPMVARLLAARRARVQEPRRPLPAAALLAPLVAGLLCSALFFPVAQTRLLAGTLLVRQAVWAAVPALLLPGAIAAAARIRLPIGWPRAGLLAGVVYGGAAIVALALTWSDNLRFAPWTEIMVGSAIAIVAAVGAWTFRDRLPATPLGAAVIALGVWVAAAAMVAGVSRYEPARKTAGARAAFVGVTLDAGRRALDFDGDGFARALGGGDCDDGEPAIHPGALDLPGDGVDADCDGEDASNPLPPPARMAELPASVPAELDLLLITIDTLRADHLGSYGYPRATSPTMDALAAEGTLFENGWAHAPSTQVFDAGHRRRPLAVRDHLGRIDLVAAHGSRRADGRGGAARARLLHGRTVQFQLLRARRSPRLRPKRVKVTRPRQSRELLNPGGPMLFQFDECGAGRVQAEVGGDAHRELLPCRDTAEAAQVASPGSYAQPV